MKKLLVLAVAILVGACSQSSKTQLENDESFFSRNETAQIATVIANCYADWNNGNDNNAGAETTPKKHIQACIDAVSSGQIVIAKPSHPNAYIENINFNGKNITVASNFINTGDPNDIYNTIIDGNHIGSVVKIVSGENSDAELTGFTIQNGCALVNTGSKGGGILCLNSSPNLNNLIITNNSAYSRGGGISASHTPSGKTVVLKNLIVKTNILTQPGYGAGIYIGEGTASIANIKLIENKNPGGGGASNGGGLTLLGINLIGNLEKIYAYGNEASFGGGIWIGLPPKTTINIVNSLVANNTTVYNSATVSECGGSIGAAGIHIDFNASVDSVVNIVNSTVAYNKSQGLYEAGGLEIDNASIVNSDQPVVNIINSIFWGNTRSFNSISGQQETGSQIMVNYLNYSQPGLQDSTLRIAYSNIEGAQTNVLVNGIYTTYPFTNLTWLAGNINTNPLFINAVPVLTPHGSENYSINLNSPCAGTGTNAISIGGQNIPIPTNDIIGVSRPSPLISHVDMGAYEVKQKPRVVGPIRRNP